MVEQEVETTPPWLAVIIIACVIALIILFIVSGDILKFLAFPIHMG
jgi:hypothetical protein